MGRKVLYPTCRGAAATRGPRGEGSASEPAGSSGCTRPSLPASPASQRAACQSSHADLLSSAGQPEPGSAPADPPGAARCSGRLPPDLGGGKERMQQNLSRIPAGFVQNHSSEQPRQSIYSIGNLPSKGTPPLG